MRILIIISYLFIASSTYAQSGLSSQEECLIQEQIAIIKTRPQNNYTEARLHAQLSRPSTLAIAKQGAIQANIKAKTLGKPKVSQCVD
jgi:hypothetical protein